MNINSDSVLITGGAGFIGSYFVEYFIDLNYWVYVIDDLSTGDQDKLPDSERLIFHNRSVLEIESFNDLPYFKYVIHLAAVVGMKLAKKDSELCHRVSVDGLTNVLSHTRADQYLLLSSSAVYGLNSDKKPLAEDHPISTTELMKYDGNRKGYASGKYEQERIAESYSSLEKPILVIRPFNVVGVGQSAHYGMVLPSFIESAIAGDTLWVYDDGEQSRCFSEVKTFVNYCIQLMDSSPKGETFRTFNLGNDFPTKIIDLAKEVVKQSGSSSLIEFMAYSDVFEDQKDVRSRVPDTNKVKEILGDLNWPDIKHIVSTCLNQK